MGVLGLIDQNKVPTGREEIEAPSTTIGDVADASFDFNFRNMGFISKELATTIDTDDRNSKYLERTGRSIYSDAVANSQDEVLKKQATGRGSNVHMNKLVDQYLDQLKQQDPQKYGDIFNTGQINEEVKRKAQEASTNLATVTAGATTMGSFGGQLAGGIAASFTDPVNLATIPLGAGLASGVIKTALVEAGINAGAEVAIYPFVKKWQEELGQEYGAGQLAENIGIAALFGAVIGGGTKAISMRLESASNSAKLAEIRERFVELRDAEAEGIKNDVLRTSQPANEVIEALRHEERRLHIDESDLTRYENGQVISPRKSQAAIEEVDAALNEGRPINYGKIGISDEEFGSIKARQSDPGYEDALRNIQEKPKAQAEVVGGNELLKDQRVVSPGVERQQEIAALRESPEFKAKERADFETAFKDTGDAAVFDDAGNQISVDDIRGLFKDDNDYLSAINSCGIGGAR